MNKLCITSAVIGMQKNARFYNVPSFLIKLKDKSESLPMVRISTVKNLIRKNKNINHIVIYGNEPLEYKLEIEKFLNDIWREDMKITIYTKGNLPILNPLSYNYKIALYIVNASETVDIDSLRKICLYSADYLLCFKEDPETIVEKSENIINKICNSEEEFLCNFLKIHNPKYHVVYVARTKEEIKQVKQICFNTGKYFNTFI